MVCLGRLIEQGLGAGEVDRCSLDPLPDGGAHLSCRAEAPILYCF